MRPVAIRAPTLSMQWRATGLEAVSSSCSFGGVCSGGHAAARFRPTRRKAAHHGGIDPERPVFVARGDSRDGRVDAAADPVPVRMSFGELPQQCGARSRNTRRPSPGVWAFSSCSRRGSAVARSGSARHPLRCRAARQSPWSGSSRRYLPIRRRLHRRHRTRWCRTRYCCRRCRRPCRRRGQGTGCRNRRPGPPAPPKPPRRVRLRRHHQRRPNPAGSRPRSCPSPESRGHRIDLHDRRPHPTGTVWPYGSRCAGTPGFRVAGRAAIGHSFGLRGLRHHRRGRHGNLAGPAARRDELGRTQRLAIRRHALLCRRQISRPSMRRLCGGPASQWQVSV